MPRQALQVCSTPGCPTLTPRGRCAACRAEGRKVQAQQRRATRDPSMDVYSTSEWRTRRTNYLADHPYCVCCGEPATEVDHVIPRRILVAAGIHDPDHPTWLQSLTKPHHSHKTRTIDAPLLQRWAAGEDPAMLAEEALRMTHGVGYTT